MPHHKRGIFPLLLVNLILSLLIYFFLCRLPLARNANNKISDALTRLELRLGSPPVAIKDLLLVTIDNQTLKNIPERWPYPRSYFAQVIDNLNAAGARAIGFDFVFLGRSDAEEDRIFKDTLDKAKNVVLATAIDEEGEIELFSRQELAAMTQSGIISKLQDSDGVTRRNLTYLVSNKEPNQGFLSWEIQLLKIAKDIDLRSIENRGTNLLFSNYSTEKWLVPVDPATKSFLIRFRAHTVGFQRLSFYRVLQGDFEKSLVKDKVVLIGLVSALFQDLHRTPIGWLPGLTLNANAFLSLYAHDFLRPLPKIIEISIILLGALLASLILACCKIKKALLLVISEICLYYTASYLLFTHGYLWNYLSFPVAVAISSLVSKSARNTGLKKLIMLKYVVKHNL